VAADDVGCGWWRGSAVSSTGRVQEHLRNVVVVMLHSCLAAAARPADCIADLATGCLSWEGDNFDFISFSLISMQGWLLLCDF